MRMRLSNVLGIRQLVLTLNNYRLCIWKSFEEYEVDGHQVRLFNLG
jgi:hypothetical protein